MRLGDTFRIAGAVMAATVMMVAGLASPAQSAPVLERGVPALPQTVPADAAPLPSTITQGGLAQGGGSSVEQLGVTCFLGWTDPFPNGLTISFSASISCDGPVQSITMQVGLYRNRILDAVNPPIAGPGPFLQDTVFTFCSSGNYIGGVAFQVVFLSGTPLVIGGSAFTDEFTIIC